MDEDINTPLIQQEQQQEQQQPKQEQKEQQQKQEQQQHDSANVMTTSTTTINSSKNDLNITNPPQQEPPQVEESSSSSTTTTTKTKKPKSKRSLQKSAQSLSNEMENYITSRARTTAYRAACYRPSLDTFQKVSFADYVRGVLLGIEDVDGVELEEPYYSDDSDDDDDVDQVDNNNDTTKDGDDNKDVLQDATISTNDINNADPMMTETNTNDNNLALSSDPITVPTPTSVETTTRMSTRRMSTRTQTKSIPSPSPGKENLYSKPYYTSPRESKDIGNNSKKRSSPSSSSSPNSIKIPELQNLQLDSLKLSDGIGKITPPEGWWDHAGIGNDLTARGEPWEKGTDLGDMVIPQPIKQCVYGIGGVYDFTMMELPPTTVAEFREQADKYRKRQIGKEFDDDESDEHIDFLAKKFWKRLGPTMESSKYGADMEGSLFDGDDACGWNVDRLESCLQLLLADVNNQDLKDMANRKLTEDDFRMPGVTSAYLYFGMWASCFCAHTEDMNLLSINYLHAGAPKYWYAISQEDSKRFESLMASLFSHQSSSCKEFLRHKRSLVSPSVLTRAGIEFTTQVQRAGDIIITYPGSYHFGFNTGFNVAESTNFAVPEWIPLGEQARVCMCHPHSVRIEMKRFKSLINQYGNDQLANMQNGRKKLSYVDWARNLVKSQIRKTQRSRKGNIDEDNEKLMEGQEIMRSLKGRVVEVLKMMPGSDDDTKNKPSGKKRRKNSSSSKKKKKDDDGPDFRLAMKIKKASLCQKKQTPVLCLLECGSDYNYFAGNVTALVDDYARIHFAGTTREDDIWIEVDSGMLFLDGGSCEKP